MVRDLEARCGGEGGRLLGGVALWRYVYYKGEVSVESICDNGDGLELMVVSCWGIIMMLRQKVAPFSGMEREGTSLKVLLAGDRRNHKSAGFDH